MADDDVHEFEPDDDEVLFWDYVEDDYPLADELAESQTADPGYAGTNYAIEMESFSYDMFEYWDDLEYGHEEYWESTNTNLGAVKAGDKRKRNEDAGVAHKEKKRRKLSLKETGGGNVRFLDTAKRVEMAWKKPPVLEKRTSFALFPDWKERFADDSGVTFSKSMPEDMKKAAEGKEEDTPPKQRQFDAEAVAAAEEEWEDEEEKGESVQAQPASIEQGMLEAALKQKLGDSVDISRFMPVLTKILSGEEGADEVADELTGDLLRQATESNNPALLGLLSQLGISLPTEEEEEVDDASSIATAELPQPVARPKRRKGTFPSPPDSAIGGLTKELAVHGSSPSASAKRKRMAPAEEEQMGATKRKVTFEVPTSSSPSEVTQPTVGGDNVEETNAEPAEIPISEDPLMSEPTILSEKTRARKTEPANASANNHTKADPTGTSSTKSKSAKYSRANTEAQPGNADEDEEDYITVDPFAQDTIAVSHSAKDSITVNHTVSAKQTRKRKAQDDGDDDEIPVAQRKQPRKAAASANKELSTGGRQTRSRRTATRAAK